MPGETGLFSPSHSVYTILQVFITHSTGNFDRFTRLQGYVCLQILEFS
jgi:hypothetical protein